LVGLCPGAGRTPALRARQLLFNKGFWSAAETDPKSPAAGIAHAGVMNRLPKTVVSTTLDGDPGWNATLVKADLAGAVAR
jgi:hypothetical protein